eukprot:378010-Prymnesium_polylepis.1
MPHPGETRIKSRPVHVPTSSQDEVSVHSNPQKSWPVPQHPPPEIRAPHGAHGGRAAFTADRL